MLLRRLHTGSGAPRGCVLVLRGPPRAVAPLGRGGRAPRPRPKADNHTEPARSGGPLRELWPVLRDNSVITP